VFSSSLPDDGQLDLLPVDAAGDQQDGNEWKQKHEDDHQRPEGPVLLGTPGERHRQVAEDGGHHHPLQVHHLGQDVGRHAQPARNVADPVAALGLRKVDESPAPIGSTFGLAAGTPGGSTLGTPGTGLGAAGTGLGAAGSGLGQGSTLRILGSTLGILGSRLDFAGGTLDFTGSKLHFAGSTLDFAGSTLDFAGSTFDMGHHGFAKVARLRVMLVLPLNCHGKIQAVFSLGLRH